MMYQVCICPDKQCPIHGEPIPYTLTTSSTDSPMWVGHCPGCCPHCSDGYHICPQSRPKESAKKEETPNKLNAYLTKEIKENPNLPKELEEIGEQIDDRVRVHDEAVEAYKKRLVKKLRAELGDWPDFSSENMHQYAYFRDNGIKAAIELVEETK